LTHEITHTTKIPGIRGNTYFTPSNSNSSQQSVGCWQVWQLSITTI